MDPGVRRGEDNMDPAFAGEKNRQWTPALTGEKTQWAPAFAGETIQDTND
jgi:hypothetical protein